MNSNLTRRTLLQAGAVTATRLAAAEPQSLKLPKQVRFALIGLEAHYVTAANLARASSDIQLVGAAASEEMVKLRAKSDPGIAIVKRYDDFRKMLDVEKPDVVGVCNENGDHAATAITCAERGIHVIVEKPLATTLEQLTALQKAAAQHKTHITVQLGARYGAAYRTMRSLIAEGEIGEPVAIGAQKSYKLGLTASARPLWMRRRASWGGSILYAGIHMIDLMRFTSGREYTEVAAFQSTIGDPSIGELENNCAIIYKLDNRGTANLRTDYLRPDSAPTHGDDRLRIIGTKGVIEHTDAGTTLINGKGPQKITDSAPPILSQFPDFLNSIYNGTKPLVSPADVWRISDVAIRTQMAAESSRMMKL